MQAALDNQGPSLQMETEHVRKWRDKGNAGYVSTLYQCHTDQATGLCIYDVTDKLKKSNTYDIGGTYTINEGELPQPDFWFYYTTSVCHGFNVLINLFVVPRRPESFSIAVPTSYQLTHQIKTDDANLAIIYGSQAHHTFRTTQKDEHIFIKTFPIDAEDIKTLKKCNLLIPITITCHNRPQMDSEVLKTIKLRHDFSSLMAKKETADMTIQSSSGTKYSVHKVLLAAHSPVMRPFLDNPDKNISLDIGDDEMEILLEFLYTGSIKNIYKQNFLMLLEIAERLKLSRLFELTASILGEQLNVENAIGIAVLAKKYNLINLTNKVFEFIKSNPETLTNEAWRNLDDIHLIKELMQFIHQPCSPTRQATISAVIENCSF